MPADLNADESWRRQDIQGLRALAILMVVAFHAGLPVPGGFVGVDVFFVISGFVITTMLQREAHRAGRISMATFYVRRFKRLMPALALMVAITVLVSAFVLPPLGAQENVALTGVGALVLVANAVVAATTGSYFDVAAELNPLLHTWSLSVEEQFYLFFPALLAVLWAVAAKRRLRWLPVLTVALLATASFGMAVAQSLGISTPLLPDWLLGFYGPLGRIWEFATGALLAAVVVGRGGPGRAIATVGSALGLVMVVSSLWLVTAAAALPGPRLLLPVVGTALVIYAGSSPNVLSRALSARPWIWVGDRSYSWYLWHWPMIVFASLLWPDSIAVTSTAAVISLFVAASSYRWVEQPLRLRSYTGSRQIAPLVTATVVPPLVLSVLLWAAAQNAFWNRDIASVRAAVTTSHADTINGCSDWESTGPRGGACVWNADAGGRPVYLVGDSKAGHLSEAFEAAAATLDRPLTIATASACPYLDVYLSLPDETRPSWWTANGCRASFERARQWLTSAEPGTVVISVNDPYLVSTGYALGVDPEELTSVVAKKQPIYVEQLVKTVTELRKAGHDVVLAQPAVNFSNWDPQRCSVGAILFGHCAATTTLEFLNKRDGPLLEATRESAALTGAKVLDYRPPLCPKGVCSTSPVAGRLAYRDGGHLSVEGSLLLTGLITELLSQPLPK